MLQYTGAPHCPVCPGHMNSELAARGHTGHHKQQNRGHTSRSLCPQLSETTPALLSSHFQEEGTGVGRYSSPSAQSWRTAGQCWAPGIRVWSCSHNHGAVLLPGRKGPLPQVSKHPLKRQQLKRLLSSQQASRNQNRILLQSHGHRTVPI